MGTDKSGLLADPRFPGALIHRSSFVDDGAIVGAGTKIWHFCHIIAGTVIGKDCSIGQNVMIGPKVTIGDRCKIQNNVSLYEGVELGSDVFCGPSCVFTNVLTPRASVSRKSEFAPTVVGQGATIGANATIVCGRPLGEWCMVGAGAVVTHRIPNFALVVGNPAKRIGWVAKAGDRLGADLVCPRTGERYELIGDELRCVS
ncbi:N-acetyltransferase [Tardiphaga alba]|uniref:N-acetyltransferase n=1 Tax=Tardiphaga alba TaxID=340268 RepID=A0ABX8A5Y9_9BRAD|nr:acyltransferase [Tardiphaga alba]QUS39134.1 N-acetyltransferase [Tardiphaga alba]